MNTDKTIAHRGEHIHPVSAPKPIYSKRAPTTGPVCTECGNVIFINEKGIAIRTVCKHCS